ncbi:MAG: N-acetyltransferase family protein [Hyphomonadaceae bacterium]
MSAKVSDSPPLARIREMRKADKASCTDIFSRTWAATFPDQPRIIDVAEFERETKGEIVFVAEQDRQIRGFAGLYVPGAFLHHLYVDPLFHGRGLGRALLDAVVKRVKSRVSLKCQRGNKSALAFYDHLGFERGDEGDDGGAPWVRLWAPPPL